jgi:hypothetical protein
MALKIGEERQGGRRWREGRAEGDRREGRQDLKRLETEGKEKETDDGGRR